MRLILWGAAVLLAGTSGWLFLRGEGKGARGGAAAPATAAEDPAALLARAERLLKDRRARPENLPEAVRLLGAARDALKPSAERNPAPYVAASERLQEAERLRDREAEDLWVEYERLRHVGDARGAGEALRCLLRLVPEASDKRNLRARTELARQLGPG